MVRGRVAPLAVASFVWLGLLSGVAAAQNGEFTTDFRFQECEFEARGENPYFPLTPRLLVLEAEEDGETVRLELTVLREFQRIRVPGLGWVKTRVIEERETVDGKLKEISRNFFASCDDRGDVAYFGEDVDIYHPDGSITHDGAWRAGKPDENGLAEPGIIMPGTFLLGSKYYQELADGIALDRAENVEMGLQITTEAGTFEDCVRVVETTPLEPGSESTKVYCPGIGLVMDNELELVEYKIKKTPDEEED